MSVLGGVCKAVEGIDVIKNLQSGKLWESCSSSINANYWCSTNVR